MDIILAVGVLGGVYLALYLVSHGKWVGDGDWLLGTAIGLALGQPFLALVVLFVANFSAAAVMYPAVRKRRSHQVHFGPFLVMGYVVVAVFSGFITSLLMI